MARRRNSALSLVLLLLGQVGILLFLAPRHHVEVAVARTQREVHRKQAD